MKIVFLPVSCSLFHGRTLDERPMGGTETAVIRLAEALDALGHEVAVVTEMPTFPVTKPPYITRQQLERMQGIDAVVVVRDWEGLFYPMQAKKRILWTGDAFNSTYNYGIGDPRLSKQIDSLVLVSRWHQETLCEKSGFPLEKTFVLRNGISLANFSGKEKRHSRRLIYSSGPNRGLKHLKPIFQTLKAKYSDLELHIFGSFTRHKLAWMDKVEEDEPYKLLFSGLSGVYFKGSIKQKDLAREFMQASILAYPTDFEETSCITAMEAQAGGCPVVTTDLAALKETVGEAGLLIEGNAKTEAYQEQFVQAVSRLFDDPALYAKLSETGKKQALHYDWSTRAQEFTEFLCRTCSL